MAMIRKHSPSCQDDSAVLVKLSEDHTTLFVEGSVSFNNVVKLRNAGKQLLAQQTPDVVTVDLQAVNNSDNSGLVLLVAWMRDARREKKTLVYRHVPDFLHRMAQVFGLRSILETH